MVLETNDTSFEKPIIQLLELKTKEVVASSNWKKFEFLKNQLNKSSNYH